MYVKVTILTSIYISYLSMCTYTPTFPRLLYSRLTLHYTTTCIIRKYTFGIPLDLSNIFTVDTVLQCALHVHTCKGIYLAIWTISILFWNREEYFGVFGMYWPCFTLNCRWRTCNIICSCLSSWCSPYIHHPLVGHDYCK